MLTGGEKARRLLEAYTPEEPESFQGNLKFFRRAPNEDALRISMTIVVMLSPDTPRGDICMALKIVEIEHGWRP